ncbi:pilus assembly PilX family protein [Biformimicrobium ophioploci]|uniref:Type 4 fimbrial biogenesis protein PilX N-terminal domain-containing protein n=1 Tax=Biformimicrobium ophioploci TaxID=3036711 RepID=A0ABQ6M2M8_9GAMM|nr:PilX N-terminal domain-containing pilus assembly protein [Microbulbifer sp. NKW57]GMG88578.1 hypothetical protein MNKW57_28990 [Microbulbifer sp. NKW57]
MQNLHSQRGAVLVVSLIILLVLTMIGISSARTVLLEEKMTYASRDAKVALEVAEALTVEAERYVDSIATTGDFNSTGHLYALGDGEEDLYGSNVWSGTRSLEAEVPMLGPDGSNLKGRFFIELAGIADKEDPANDIAIMGYGQSTGGGEIKVFRIVAMGYGINDATQRILITRYGRRF